MYAGVVNTTNTPTFIVLQSTATASDINTALTNYDVVYLEPGTYSMVNVQVSIPSSKKLIGLGDWYGSPAVLQWSGSPANHIYMNNGWIENLQVYLSGTIHSGGVIVGDGTDKNNYLFKISIRADTVYNYPAYSGPANEMVGMYIYNLGGINWTGTGYSDYATIQGIYMYNPQTYGIQFGANSNLMIKDVVVNGNSKTTTYGIYSSINADIYRVTIDNCYMYNCDNGYYIAQTAAYGTHWTCELRMVRCVADNCHAGLYIVGSAISQFTDLLTLSCGESTSGCAYYFKNSAENSFKGLISNDCQGYNFYFDNTEDSTIEGCRASGGTRGYYIDGGFYDSAMSNCCAQYCNATSGGHGNFIFVNASRSSFSNLASMIANNTGNYGYYIATCSNTVFNGLTDYESTYGVYVSGASVNNCSIGNINSWNPGTTGFYVSNHTRGRLIVNNVTVYHAGSNGIEIAACDNSEFFNLFSSNSTGYGIYIGGCDYSTFSNLSAIDNSNVGNYLVSNTYCAFTNILARYNRGSTSYHGTYMQECHFCTIQCVICYDNAGSGLYLDHGQHYTCNGITSLYDDVCGIFINHGDDVILSNASIYGTGSYGVDLHSLTYSIVSGILTDSCVTYGQYYETPLRSQFQDNRAVNQSAGGNYGYYFLNNGTGYNHLADCNYSNCASGYPSGGGYGNWNYDHDCNFD
jgi:hypothetical protein